MPGNQKCYVVSEELLEKRPSQLRCAKPSSAAVTFLSKWHLMKDTQLCCNIRKQDSIARNDVMSKTSQIEKDTITSADLRTHGQTWRSRVGVIVSRYGLVVVLLLIGVEKFTPAEAEGIRPLIDHSPLMAWMYSVMSQQVVSNRIGVIEVLVAVLMALRPLSARMSFFGSFGATATFLITVSFLITTPGVFIPGHRFPLLGDIGQFLIKDLVLLGASLWTAADAFDVTPWIRA